MIRASIEVQTGFVDQYRRDSIQRIEQAAVAGIHKATRGALGQIRAEMRSSGLGGLGNAITSTTDQDKGRVYRRAGDNFSASGIIHLRVKSPRTVGAIISYTEGANIVPVKGRWLWVPTDDIQRLVGSGRTRARLTPALWSKYGLDSKIGPLQLLPQRGKPPLLIVKNVGVSAAGKSRSARSLTKSGRPRKGQIQRDFIVAFYAIPRTTRTQRVDLLAVARRWADVAAEFIADELRRGQ